MRSALSKLLLPVVFLLLLTTRTTSTPTVNAAPQQSAPTQFPAKIERLNPALDKIVPPDATWTRVATGFTWVEGPVWTRGGYLLFAEIASNSIRKLNQDGSVSIWLQPSGYRGSDYYGKEPGTNGMTLDPRGRLTVAGHAARNITRFETLDPHGTVTILADSYEGKKLNSPNDLVYAPDGSLYFTDPPYGLRKQNDSDPEKELKVNGVYRIQNAVNQKPGAPPNHGALQLLVSDLERPNGIAFSPDHKWLYVSNTQPRKWMRYPVKPDGTLGPGAVFVDATSDPRRIGAPDGMKVDNAGNIFAAGPGGVWIISPEGKHLGTLLTDKATANVAWGEDGSTLFTTTTDSVYKIHLNTKGTLP
jgi:gluconolactonase